MDNILMNIVSYDGKKTEITRSFEIESHKSEEFYDDFYEKNKVDGERGYELAHINGQLIVDDEYYMALTSVEGMSITCASTQIDDDGYFGTWFTSFPVSKDSERGGIVLQFRENMYTFIITTDYGVEHVISTSDKRTMNLMVEQFRTVVDIDVVEIVNSICTKIEIDGVVYKHYADKYHRSGIVIIRKRYLVSKNEAMTQNKPVLKVFENKALVEDKIVIDNDTFNYLKREL